MFGLVRKKTHDEAIRLWGEALGHWDDDARYWRERYTEQQQVLEEGQEGLNLIEAYQRALSVISAADPNIARANAFLEKFNRKSDPNATYLGAQRTADWNEKMGTPPPGPSRTFALPTSEARDRWKREEEEWGDEAYGQGHVRIEAEAIDEGEEKEPGITRAQVRFVDVEHQEEPSLTAAKATTAHASK